MSLHSSTNIIIVVKSIIKNRFNHNTHSSLQIYKKKLKMSAIKPPFIKKIEMDKISVVLFICWIVLAIASFVCAFFATPFIVKLIGIIFGAENTLIIISWLLSIIQAKKVIDGQKDKENV